MDLDAVRQQLVIEIRDKLRYVAAGRPAASLADLYDAVAEEFEALAICHLVEEADTFQFRQNLARAGHGRRHFLRRSAIEANVADRHLALSRNRGFLGAVASGSLAVARDIATLSQAPFDASWEYEDDHAFYRVCHAIVLSPDSPALPEIDFHLRRFSEVLEGAPSPELEALRALVERDARGLEAAVGSLLAGEAVKNGAALRSAKVVERDLLIWPAARVSITALALLNLGELLGVRVPAELPRCPRLGRVGWSEDRFDDLFEELEQL